MSQKTLPFKPSHPQPESPGSSEPESADTNNLKRKSASSKSSRPKRARHDNYQSKLSNFPISEDSSVLKTEPQSEADPNPEAGDPRDLTKTTDPSKAAGESTEDASASAWKHFFSAVSTSASTVTTTSAPALNGTTVALPSYNLAEYTLPTNVDLWDAGQPIPYLALAKTFEKVSKTRARLEQTQIMRDFFRAALLLTPTDVVLCVWLSTNLLAAVWKGLELGVGESLIQKAIVEATGKALKTLKAEYDHLGDLGLVAQESVSSVRTLIKPKPLTVRGVHSVFIAIASETGAASQKRRIDKIRGLMVSARDSEANFIVKALQGKMRINMGPKTVLTALAHAFVYVESKKLLPSDQRLEEATLLLEQTYNQRPDWELIIESVVKYGLSALSERVQLEVGIPFAPMLAQPTKGIGEILTRLEGKSFTAEWKYDGERAQIHMLESGEIRVYSRNLDNTTEKFPDILRDIKNAFSEDTKSFIIDCEAVAWSKEEHQIMPFQILSTRARKQVSLEDIKVPVCLFVFDLVYLNGESLIKMNLVDRRKLLHEHFNVVPDFFQFATYRDLNDPADIQEWLELAVEGKCEGLMVKTLEIDATYQAAKRAYQWLKVKKDYLDGMGDTLDLVPIGAYLGRGKRTGVFGGFLLACYDPDSESFQSISKIGTGFTDAQLSEFTETLKAHQISHPPHYYIYTDQKNIVPDIWLEPTVVWEIKAADLSLSPNHHAAVGLVHESRGIALRFPRLVRVRTDKTPEDATTSEQVAQMYRNQGNVQPRGDESSAAD